MASKSAKNTLFSESSTSVARLSCFSLFSTETKSGNYRTKNILLVQLSKQNPGCASGRIHCCRQIFQAIMGRKRNQLRSAAGLILKLRIICSRTRSDFQVLYAKVKFISVTHFRPVPSHFVYSGDGTVHSHLITL